MSTYCGPVSVDDIYFGLARVLSRYEMPVPQPELLERILCNNGYIHEDGLWYWADGETVDLSQGEYLILETIATNAGVAHFSQLARAITEDGLHYASVAGTLSRSPLFDNFAYGLYKLRGTSPSHQSIEDARASSDDIPVDLKYEYDVGGSIVVEANLSLFALGGGTITSERLSSLKGEWHMATGASGGSAIKVTDNQIWGLKAAFVSLGCKAGNRVRLRFNVDTRHVVVSLIEEST